MHATTQYVVQAVSSTSVAGRSKWGCLCIKQVREKAIDRTDGKDSLNLQNREVVTRSTTVTRHTNRVRWWWATHLSTLLTYALAQLQVAIHLRLTNARAFSRYHRRIPFPLDRLNCVLLCTTTDHVDRQCRGRIPQSHKKATSVSILLEKRLLFSAGVDGRYVVDVVIEETSTTVREYPVD